MPTRPTNPTQFLTADEQAAVERAIDAVEQQTSAEVRLLIARHCWGDIRDKAQRLFVKHGMDKTERRNAVLILLITTNREFFIYGDKGIHDKVDDPFWQDVRDLMTEPFRAGRFGDGLCAGIQRIGEPLATHFPPDPDHDPNELPNEVAFEQ
ncbi:MAG: TPM domain-containing protein [Phycisphaeraceae bacterium]